MFLTLLIIHILLQSGLYNYIVTKEHHVDVMHLLRLSEMLIWMLVVRINLCQLVRKEIHT
jgi:hypothetical protein